MVRYFQVNENGHNIRCKLYCREPKLIRQIVLFCHGFGGHKDNSAAEKFADRLITKHKSTALVTFDLPCHGEDVKKKLVFDHCTDYLHQVTLYLLRTFSPERLYAYATSFGGYLLLRYISEHGSPFFKIALRCPAVDMYQVMTDFIAASPDADKLQKGKDILLGFDRKVPVSLSFLQSLEDIRNRDYLDFAEDMLILHGTADEIVPFDSAYRFAEDNLIELIPVAGADHRFRHSGSMELAIKHILDFFSL